VSLLKHTLLMETVSASFHSSNRDDYYYYYLCNIAIELAYLC